MLFSVAFSSLLLAPTAANRLYDLCLFAFLAFDQMTDVDDSLVAGAGVILILIVRGVR
jgi:hypothetical protein